VFCEGKEVSVKYDYLADESRFRYYLNRVEPYVTEKPFPHPWLGRSAFENGPVTVGPGAMVSEREVRRATAAYYANVERIDDQFASVVHELHEAGEDIDDWIIVYAGDHGEMLGQHSIWEKQKFFEASARVPLIIRYPRRFAGARHVHSNVNLIDLFATLCELTNTPVPEGLDSRSLVPLMDGNTADWDNYTMSQFDGWSRMIKRDHYKFQQFDGRYPEVLFDLKTDPGETRNCADDPAYADVVKRLRDELSQAVQR
jgi:choline-sulfatase